MDTRKIILSLLSGTIAVLAIIGLTDVVRMIGG